MDRATQFFESLSLPKFDKKETHIISIVAATSLLYASYKLISLSSQKKKGMKEIPSPKSAYPYVGHMLSLGDYPGQKVAEWHQELGPIVKIRMGVKTWILVNDPVLAHKLFVTNGVQSSYRPHSTWGFNHYSLGGLGLAFNQPNPSWKEARTAALSILAPKQIEKYMDTIHKESSALVDRLLATSEKEGSFFPIKCLELNSMNVIFQAGFGIRFDSVNDPEFVKISDMIETSLRYAATENDLANFLPVISIIDYFAGTQVKYKKYINNMRNPVYRKLIQDASERDGNNLVKSLGEDGFNLSADEKLVFMSDLAVAGTDTVSVTLAWNIAIMCHHPEVQKKAAAEIDEFIKLNGRLPNFNERTEVPYCVSVIKECMRCKPTTPFGLPHTVYEDIEIDGYIIPANATIISSMDSMHRNADVYPEPEKFSPERFIDNLKTMQSAANGRLEERDHFNFGWGRRICPAIYLAEVEIFAAYVRLMSRCTIVPSSEGLPSLAPEKNAGLTTVPAPYKVKFIKRADSLLA